MFSGIQVFNDYGLLQIDSDFINMCFLRKGSLSTTTYMNGSGVVTNPTRATVTVNDNELIAFSSTVPVAIIGRDGNTVTLAAESPAGATINYWIFGGASAESDFGLQVYKSDGSLAFDSAWKLMNFLGGTSGNGNTSIPTGKTMAVVPQSMYFNTEYKSVIGGVSPSVFVIDSRVTRMSAAKIESGVLSVSTAIVDVWAFTRTNTGTVGPSGMSDNGVTPQYLMIDVTGL